MSAHLSDLELDALVEGATLQTATSRHLEHCGACQGRLSRMAASEVELLLVASTGLFVAPVEHSQVRYIARVGRAPDVELAPARIEPRSSGYWGRTQQLLKSCAMVFALGFVGWISQPIPRPPARSADATWITSGCRASQPWCPYISE